VNDLPEYLKPPPPRGGLTAEEQQRKMFRDMRLRFLHEQAKLRPSTDDHTVLFDPDADPWEAYI